RELSGQEQGVVQVRRRLIIGQDRVVRLIALFKFCKATLLVAVGLGALQLLHPDVAARAQQWVAALATNSDRQIVQQLIALIGDLSPARLEALGIGAFLYAALFATEGVGLWLLKRWAEYLMVIATLTFGRVAVLERSRKVRSCRHARLLLHPVVSAYLAGRRLSRRG